MKTGACMPVSVCTEFFEEATARRITRFARKVPVYLKLCTPKPDFEIRFCIILFIMKFLEFFHIT